MRTTRLTILFGILILVLSACGSTPPSDVTVSLSEWAIEPMDLTVAAGIVTFNITNTGTIDHDFAIEGVTKIELITPGDTKALEVMLEPGTYNLLCDLSGHKEAGMTGTLTVVAVEP